MVPLMSACLHRFSFLCVRVCVCVQGRGHSLSSEITEGPDPSGPMLILQSHCLLPHADAAPWWTYVTVLEQTDHKLCFLRFANFNLSEVHRPENSKKKKSVWVVVWKKEKKRKKSRLKKRCWRILREAARWITQLLSSLTSSIGFFSFFGLRSSLWMLDDNKSGLKLDYKIPLRRRLHF